MQIQVIDIQLPTVLAEENVVEKTKKATPRKSTKTIVWTPAVKTKRDDYNISLTTPIFAIPDIVFHIFNNAQLSITDVVNFEAVCKGHSYVTYGLWDTLRRTDNLTYNWKVCDTLEFKEKTNYILSVFFLQYAETANYKRLTKEITQKLAIISKPFPIFKTFSDGMEVSRTSNKSLEKVYDQLREEPILHATLRIYETVKGLHMATKYHVPLFPVNTFEIALQAINAGATCLGKLAVTLCKQRQKTSHVIKERYSTFLYTLTYRAKMKGDNSGREALSTYAQKKGFYASHSKQPSLYGLAEKQAFIDLSPNERILEIQRLKKCFQVLSASQTTPETMRDFFLSIENTIQKYVAIQRYELAEFLLDTIRKKNFKLSSYQSYVAALKIKYVRKKPEEMNTFFEETLSMKQRTVTQDISFLAFFAEFKLQFQNGDPETAHLHLMEYWKTGAWRDSIFFHYGNCKLDIQTVEDLQHHEFQEFLRLMIITKEKLGLLNQGAWFKNVQAAIMLDQTDKEASLSLHNEWMDKDFYQDKHTRFLPSCLQRKIKEVGKTYSHTK